MDYGKYQQLGLYPHNEESYDKVKSAFESGKDVVGIVHATGTGKSYNALQLALDNKDKKIVYVVPSKGIIEHLMQIIEDNPNLDLKRDFPNLEFRTYSSFTRLNKEDIEAIPCDLLILDEFHHLGAPVWGAKIDSMIETHPNMKVFGMTAYTVRDRGTIFERDMANPETEEIFSNNVVSKYDLCDAMIDGVLPKPIYKTAYVNLLDMEQKIEDRLIKSKLAQKDKDELQDILKDIKKKIHEAPSIPELLKKSLKQNGKYIYFCPPGPQDGVNDIESIKKQTIEYLKRFIPEEDIIVYTSTSDMGELGKDNRVAFYNDKTLTGEKVDNKFRIMFAINQYNEGIHAPNVDGVIMGRGTSSDIVFYEQLGRGLNVRGNTKEQFEYYNRFTVEELIDFCNKKGIAVKDEYSKDNIIEKLIAPIIIDLTNNYDYIKELEDRLGNKIKEKEIRNEGNPRLVYLHDSSFDIEVENKDLYEMLLKINNKLTPTWEDYYELAKNYYNYYGNLEIPPTFFTFDGINRDNQGIKLGHWIMRMRQANKGRGGYLFTSEQYNLLSAIGMRWENINPMEEWMKKFKIAEAYYKSYGNLEVPNNFTTKDGITNTGDKNDFDLGKWISRMRQAKKGHTHLSLSTEQIELLSSIGMRWDNKDLMEEWMKKFKIAEAYYKSYGDLKVPTHFYTKDGITNTGNMNDFDLGRWIANMRRANKGECGYVFTSEQYNLLSSIGMRWENIDFREEWMKKYRIAEVYYNVHGDLEVPDPFYTKDGITNTGNKQDFNLGAWIVHMRQAKKGRGGYKFTPEQYNLLSSIGMRWENLDLNDRWMKKYKIAEAYYKTHGDLKVPVHFKTTDGITEDENGLDLWYWLSAMRQAKKGYGGYRLTSEQYNLLSSIGMRWEEINQNEEWMKKYKMAETYYKTHGDLIVPDPFYTKDGIVSTGDKQDFNLGSWIINMRKTYKKEGLKRISQEQYELLKAIGMRWEEIDRKEEWLKKYKIAEAYYKTHGDLIVPDPFYTKDGIVSTGDKNDFDLGSWIKLMRRAYKGQDNKKINSEQIALLEKIGMVWFQPKTDEKLQTERINDINRLKKRKEILNRLNSLLGTYEGDSLPSKNEMQEDFINQLDSYKQRK